MPQISHNFFKAAVVFLIVGVLMGLQMAISGAHNVIGAHAHTNLLGWVSMAIFGGYYALNPAKAATRLASVHFWTYVASVAVMVPALYLLYLGYGALEPLVALSSLLAGASAVVFAVVVFSAADLPAPEKPGAVFAG
jgi:cbb3-type cytochrome oxidase subunit 1